MANPLLSAFPDGEKNTGDVRRYLAESFALIKTDASQVPLEDYSLTPYLAIIFNTDIFEYDAADLTTAHDGLTCLVSLDDRRYKIKTRVYIKHKVDDKDTTAQPGAPSVGDAYLLPAAPTGADWASKAKHIATYTGAFWVFDAPVQGDICYIIDENVFYHYPASGIWTIGLGDLGLADASIKPKHLQKPMGLMVEAEQNDPPASVPGDGVAYIVGSAPTGAWIGNGGNVAISNGTTWNYLSAVDGAQVWNKALGYVVVYLSAVWARANESPVILQSIPITVDNETKSGLAYSTWHDVLTVPVTSAVGRIISIDVERFSAVVPAGAGSTFSTMVRLRRDAEAIDILEATDANGDEVILIDRIFIEPADSASHDYIFQIRYTYGAVSNVDITLDVEIREIDNTIITALD